MAEDWFDDVNKHAPGANAAVVRGIVRHCGIALRNPDSSLVSFGDPAEVGRIRERFLRKKLALVDDDSTLDRGIAAVRDHMVADRTKNRVTVYYLLADWFGKHDLFGGSATTPGSFSFASVAAPVASDAPPKTRTARKASASAAKIASAPAATAARAPRKTAAAPAAAATPVAPVPAPAPPPASSAPEHQSLYTAPEGSAARPMYIGYRDEGGGMVWPHWSAFVALLIAVIAAVLLIR